MQDSNRMHFYPLNMLAVLSLNLAGVLGGIPKGLLLDQATTMGQGPTVTSLDVLDSLRTFTDGRNPSIERITRRTTSMIGCIVILKAHSQERLK